MLSDDAGFTLTPPSSSDEEEERDVRQRVQKRQRRDVSGLARKTSMHVEPMLFNVDADSRDAFVGKREDTERLKRSHSTRHTHELSAGQATVVDLALMQNKNIIVMGPPGVGKTHTLITLINAFQTTRPEQVVAVLAPTNDMVTRLQDSDIAAMTVFRFFNITPPDLQMVSLDMVATLVRSKLKAAGSHPLLDVAHLTIVLEEAFMIGSRMFRLIEHLLRFFGDSSKIAGGAQIIMTGAPCQLPPVRDGVLFENNQMLCMFDAIVMLRHQHRIKSGCFADILSHVMDAPNDAAARLTPQMLRDLQVCHRPFSNHAEDPRQQHPLCNVPIVAPHNKTVNKINQDIYNKLDGREFRGLCPQVELRSAHGIVKTTVDDVNRRLAAMEGTKVSEILTSHSVSEIRRMALVKFTTSGADIVNGQLMRIVSVDPPLTQLATEAEQQRAFEEEAEQQVSEGNRLYFSDFLPIVKLVPVDDPDVRPTQMPTVIAFHAIPQFEMQSSIHRGSSARRNHSKHFQRTANRLNPSNSKYPKIWVAHAPIRLGWATSIHSLQGATANSLFVADPRSIWGTGMGLMLIFRVRRPEHLRFSHHMSESEWNRILRIDPKARSFLQRLRPSKTNTAHMLVNGVKCIYTSVKTLHDDTLVLLRDARLKQVLVNTALRHTSVSDSLLTRTFDAREAGAGTRANTAFSTTNPILRKAMRRATDASGSSTTGRKMNHRHQRANRARAAEAAAAKARRRRRKSKGKKKKVTQTPRRSDSRQPTLITTTDGSLGIASPDHISLGNNSRSSGGSYHSQDSRRVRKKARTVGEMN